MKKNHKQKNEKNKIIIIIIVLIVAFIGLLVYLYLNSEDKDTNLTILEKQWIENNKDTLIDIEVINNIEIIGNDGIGMVFDFINSFESETGLEFNKISYNYPNNNANNGLVIKVIPSSDKIKENDLILSYDNYLLIGKEIERITGVHDLYGKTIGILEQDNALVNNYLKDATKVAVKNYKSIDAIIAAFDKNEISNMILPNFIYLNETTKLTTATINYQIKDIYNTILIRMGEDKRLNNIVTKYFEKWISEDAYVAYNNQLFNYYMSNAGVLDKDKASLTARVYRYGYVDTIPYNTVSNGSLYGTAGEYINMLSTMSNIEFKYIKYQNQEALKKALDNKEVDVAFIDFSYNSNEYTKTVAHFEEEVVGIAKRYINVTTLDSLKGYRLYTFQKSHIYEYLNSKEYAIDVVNDIHNDYKNGILIIDKGQYLHYDKGVLQSYHIIFEDSIDKDYTFVVKNNDQLLYDLLNFTTTYGNYNNYKVRALNELNTIIENTNSFGYIIKLILIIIFIPIILIIIGTKVNQKRKEKNSIKKEDRLRYTDMLTSLKNRNYLNKNMKNWGETKVYPRTIVIVDLNNLKYVNDNYGYEAGNDLIVQAASILINTQLEKSEIIRTDGNEFLIYLLGYTEKQVETYATKLQKEFDKLPYGFGAALGYSMITDEIKTIDDAINEATIEMRTNKELGNSKE